jgi:hypothetical protein
MWSIHKGELFMRRAIVTCSVFIIGILVSCATYFLFNNHEDVITYDDFVYDELVADESGFHGKFQSVDIKKRICGYDYEIKDGTLFLSIKATSGTKEVFEIDDDGYVTIEFQTEEVIEKVVYRCGNEENELDLFIDQGE